MQPSHAHQGHAKIPREIWARYLGPFDDEDSRIRDEEEEESMKEAIEVSTSNSILGAVGFRVRTFVLGSGLTRNPCTVSIARRSRAFCLLSQTRRWLGEERAAPQVVSAAKDPQIARLSLFYDVHACPVYLSSSPLQNSCLFEAASSQAVPRTDAAGC